MRRIFILSSIAVTLLLLLWAYYWKEALFGFFVGQVIKASKGKANPKVVNQRLRAKLK